jgi:hypothetical protein
MASRWALSEADEINDDAVSQPPSFGIILVLISLQAGDRDLGRVLDGEAVADR